MVSRKYTRENPGKSIGKEIFAQKLTEAYLQFYKPLTVINAFKSSGIYPVDSSVITSDTLKPALTFSSTEPVQAQDIDELASVEDSAELTKAKGALEVFEETISTPALDRYQNRIQEGYDVGGQSPCFDVYRKLFHKANPTNEASTSTSSTKLDIQNSRITGLDILADAALNLNSPHTSGSINIEDNTNSSIMEHSASNMVVSPVLSKSQGSRNFKADKTNNVKHFT